MKSIEMYNKGCVSVCMATFNGEKFIKEQIDSILYQLSTTDELVISDDGSTDSTLDIIESYHDPRIRLFHHQHPVCQSRIYRTNIYVTANIENALLQSKGEYIFLSDQDDIWISGKVSQMKNALNKKGGVVISAIKVIHSNGTIKKDIVVPKLLSFIKGLFVAKYLGSSMALSRDFLNVVLPFPRGIVSHDAWIGLLATFQKKLRIINEPLLLYRRHNYNVTSDSIKTPLFFKLRYRFVLFYNVIKRSIL